MLHRVARIGSEGVAGAARGLVFVFVLVAIIVGPQHLGWLVGARPSLDGWAMYHDLGVGLVDARFVQVDTRGLEIDLDPLQVLRSEPRQISRRLRSMVELEALARRMCAALGPAAEVRAHARQATQDGWRVVATGERDLCAMQPAGAR